MEGFPLFDFRRSSALLKQKITLPFQSACRAVFPSVEDDLQVQVIPALTREEAFGVSFRLLDVFSVGKPPAVHQAVDVGIHGEGWNPKCLRHHHGRRFVTDPRKVFKGFKIDRHFTGVAFEQNLAQPVDVFDLAGESPHGRMMALILIHAQFEPSAVGCCARSNSAGVT